MVDIEWRGGWESWSSRLEAKVDAKRKECMKMTQSCFLQAEKKNGKSFVRQLWLRTRRSEIQCEMNQSYC